ncbi:hypothetical protein [Bartonella sp. ML70XJBT.G]|uniref:hypothetical protein n=1 Tax=Bartonella sp. ML70XJBT.G TaxID=3019093 RepID=UPI002360F7AC|nr:hypothetical protein [Bartonella sp. ML70XJBT.G]
MEEISPMKPEAGETVGMSDEGLPSVLQGRNNTTQQVSFLRARIKHTDQGLVTKIGVLPRGAFLKDITIYTLKDFDLTNVVFGKTIHGDEYGKATLFSPNVDHLLLPIEIRDVPQDTEQLIYMTQETKSSKGEAEVIVEFYTNR